MFIAGRYLIWSTPCFQTGISFFEIQGVGLFQQTSLLSLSCLPSVTCLRRCLNPLLYSFFVSCTCLAFLIVFYSHTFCPTMLNLLVPLFYRAIQSLVSHSNLHAESTSTSPSLLLLYLFFFFVFFFFVVVVIGVLRPLCFSFACLSSFRHE